MQFAKFKIALTFSTYVYILYVLFVWITEKRGLPFVLWPV